MVRAQGGPVVQKAVAGQHEVARGHQPHQGADDVVPALHEAHGRHLLEPERREGGARVLLADIEVEAEELDQRVHGGGGGQPPAVDGQVAAQVAGGERRPEHRVQVFLEEAAGRKNLTQAVDARRIRIEHAALSLTGGRSREGYAPCAKEVNGPGASHSFAQGR